MAGDTSKLDALIQTFEAQAVGCGVAVDAEMKRTFQLIRDLVKDGHATDEEAAAAFQLACGLADAEVPEHLGSSSMAKLALRQTGWDVPDDT